MSRRAACKAACIKELNIVFLNLLTIARWSCCAVSLFYTAAHILTIHETYHKCCAMVVSVFFLSWWSSLCACGWLWGNIRAEPALILFQIGSTRLLSYSAIYCEDMAREWEEKELYYDEKKRRKVKTLREADSVTLSTTQRKKPPEQKSWNR